MSSARLAVALLVCLCYPLSCLSSDGKYAGDEATGDIQDPMTDELDSIITSVPESLGKISNGRPVRSLSESIQQAYDQAMIRRLEHEAWELDHRERIFEWQHWAGVVVFVAAIGIVSAGLMMSWMQFRLVLAPLANGHTDKQASDQQPSETTSTNAPRLDRHRIELSATSAKVSTSFVGVTILTLSLAFFYLYLNFVFVIS